MTTIDETKLREAAIQVAGLYEPSTQCSSGSVGAALLTKGGNIYTGINIDAVCGIGFCAEHAAVAEMLKHRESEVVAVAAVTSDGVLLPPCGRCRELIYQVNPFNLAARILLDGGESYTLEDLLPRRWQEASGWE